MSIFSKFFSRINKELKTVCTKRALILGLIFLAIGILNWILCSNGVRVACFWQFPRTAMPVFLVYFFWAISYFLIGVLISACFNGIERFRRHLIYKDILVLVIMQVFSYISYSLFWGASAPFLAFLALMIASCACLIEIVSLAKYFSVWTIFLSIHLMWLLYNAYVSLAFAIIN